MTARKPEFGTIRNFGQATLSLNRYGEVERQLDALEKDYDDQVAALRKETDRAKESLEKEKATLERRLRKFATEIRPTLPAGKKTISLSTGDLYWQPGRRRVFIGRLKEATVIKRIKRLGKGPTKQYVRVKESLDKQAMLRHLPQIPGVQYPFGEEEFHIEARSKVGSARSGKIKNP